MFDEVLVRPKSSRRGDAHVHADLDGSDRQRAGHIVLAVAGKGDRKLGQGTVRMLAHGQEIGERLGRVGLVGKPVVDRHAGVVGQLLDELSVRSRDIRSRRTSAPAPGRCPSSIPCGRYGCRVGPR